ncbi:HIR complex subunit [Quaeritorhiza haematococci]|nr:HIR complex subunit [Quaeritorhiza haematococci]
MDMSFTVFPIQLFNPVIFELPADAQSKETKVSAVCAVGSQDAGVSIWWTAMPRAVVAATNIFSHSVLDMSWTPDGYTLMACSFDGTVQVLRFDEKQFGTALPQEEKDKVLSQYGFKRKKVAVPENPQQLSLEEQNAIAETSASSSRITNLMSGKSSSTTGAAPAAASTPDRGVVRETAFAAKPATNVSSPEVAARQKVTRTGDGRKRITPVFVGSTTDIGVLPTPAVSMEPQRKGLEDEEAMNFESSRIGGGGLPTTAGSKRKADSDIDTTNSSKVARKDVKYILPSIIALSGQPVCLAIPVVEAKISAQVILKIAAKPVTVNVECINRQSTEAPISFLDCCGSYAMVLTSVGNIYVWDVPQQNAILHKESIGHLLLAGMVDEEDGRDITITNASVRPEGVPLLTLSQGDTYTYHPGMKTWLKMTSTKSSRLDGNGLLSMIHSQRARENSLSFYEYRKWLKLYARKLADEGATSKARELCDELLGSANTEHWDPLILGLPKRELLKEIIPILAKNRSLQRTTTTYDEALRTEPPITERTIR